MISYLIACGILAVVYFYLTKEFDYWEKRGVIHEKGLPLIGNYIDIFLKRKNLTQYLDTKYKKYRGEKVFGFFDGTKPGLLLIDPDIIKRVFNTHFQAFPGRGLLPTDNDYSNLELLRRNMLVVEGDVWKVLRLNSAPAFKSANIKAMFPLIAERAQRLQERVGSAGELDVRGACELDARELMSCYTTGVIGAYGLGIDPDTLNDEHSAFRKIGDIILYSSKIQNHFRCRAFAPYLLANIIKAYGQLEKPFCELVKDIVRQRGDKPTGRNDFMDLMLENKNKGKMECKSVDNTKPDGIPKRFSMELDDDLIAAQIFLFFVAGFETSSFATSYTLHQLAYNPEQQRKVHADIDRALAKHDHVLCYEAVKEMTYLEKAFKEGLRMLPSVGCTIRTCRQKYTFEDLGFTIDEGMRIFISMHSLHNDPRYWDGPEEFRPERFNEESTEPRHSFAYLPFGAGPRACIGERLAMAQSAAGLAAVLARFSVAPAPRSVRRPVLSTTSVIAQHIPAGLPLLFIPRTTTQPTSTTE